MPPPPARSGSPTLPGQTAATPDPQGNGAAVAGGSPAGHPAPDTSSDSPSTRRSFKPQYWALWRRPKAFIAFLLVAELAAVAWFVLVFVDMTAPTRLDLLRFAILTAGATVHIQMTRRQEERRRNRVRTVLIDLTAVWVFPAAIILPAPLTIGLVLLIRVQHWFVARRPAHNFVFSSITHMLAATVAHRVFVALGGQQWMSLTALSSLGEFAKLLLVGLVYEAVQILYVGSILSLSGKSKPTIRSVLGSKADNLLEAITIGLGAVTAILLVILPPTVAIMAVVTVVFNRLAELDQLQDDVRTDPKTQVYNMRGWTESAERALARAAKSDDNLGILMIDLDHFKWINDTYGHPAGDDVLRNLAQLLDEVTRPADVVGRFGGEEFLVLLPDADQAAATGAAERIRSSVARLRIATTDKRGDQITVSDRTASIGVAVFPDHGDSLEKLMHAADAAVYEAKEGGRNQVRLAEHRAHHGATTTH
ncbi:diguanylate cyclase (GGDEF) domain-containing protein [Amycolatopsis sacchari]|uniref:Diguanylate cyclase (GGDEF) domain-containing protein n=1 Tax=Amycolatopsis sacchari TaxID=115433 RepID=A0A1I3MQ54_9PSEU|nr:diguanylate cyclase (GGDEF) domain-containing protein [Amycolatopsis sacchari]